jgi:hypothetical protein
MMSVVCLRLFNTETQREIAKSTGEKDFFTPCSLKFPPCLCGEKRLSDLGSLIGA